MERDHGGAGALRERDVEDAVVDGTRAIVVRRSVPDDLDRAAELFDLYRQFYGLGSALEAGRAYLAARMAQGESVVLLASLAGAPGAPNDEPTIGFAQLYRSFSSLSLARIVILNDLFVAPEARGRGVAARLIEASTAYARSEGAIRLELATERTNRSALALYETRGFVADTVFVHLSLELPPLWAPPDGG